MHEHRETFLWARLVRNAGQRANAPHAAVLLRAGGEWPRAGSRRVGKACDECAPPHTPPHALD